MTLGAANMSPDWCLRMTIEQLAQLAPDFSVDHVSGGRPVQAGIDFSALGLIGRNAWSTLELWITSGYQEAPALMVGLAPLILIPVLAIVGFAVNLHLSFLNVARTSGPAVGTIADIETRWPRDAWITIEGGAAERREISCEMLNIGRDDDNDLQLEHVSVHRHHAVLHRSSDALIYVRDLSGDKGNGIKVNGERVRHVALTDGDRVEVGAFTFKFEAHPM